MHEQVADRWCGKQKGNNRITERKEGFKGLRIKNTKN